MEKVEIKRRRKVIKDFLFHSMAYSNRKDCYDRDIARGAEDAAKVLVPLISRSKSYIDELKPSFDSIMEEASASPDLKESRLFLMYLQLSECGSFSESSRLKTRINALELSLIGYASEREL